MRAKGQWVTSGEIYTSKNLPWKNTGKARKTETKNAVIKIENMSKNQIAELKWKPPENINIKKPHRKYLLKVKDCKTQNTKKEESKIDKKN